MKDLHNFNDPTGKEDMVKKIVDVFILNTKQ